MAVLELARVEDNPQVHGCQVCYSDIQYTACTTPSHLHTGWATSKQLKWRHESCLCPSDQQWLLHDAHQRHTSEDWVAPLAL